MVNNEVSRVIFYARTKYTHINMYLDLGILWNINLDTTNF